MLPCCRRQRLTMTPPCPPCLPSCQAMERCEAELKAEEAAKEQLCGELNMLVQQSATAQLDKFEQLKTQLDTLYRWGAARCDLCCCVPLCAMVMVAMCWGCCT